MDEVNIPKELAHLLAERHAGALRYSQRLGRWLRRDGEYWRVDDGGARRAAEELCREVGQAQRNWHIGSAAMAAAVARLAAFEAKLIAPMPAEEIELELFGKGGRHV